MDAERVQCLLGSHVEGEGTVVSPRRRQPKKDTEAVAQTAAWKGSVRVRREWRMRRCSSETGGRDARLKPVPSLSAALRISWRRSSSPCQGAWLRMCHMRTPESHWLMVLPRYEPAKEEAKAERRWEEAGIRASSLMFHWSQNWEKRRTPAAYEVRVLSERPWRATSSALSASAVGMD